MVFNFFIFFWTFYSNYFYPIFLVLTNYYLTVYILLKISLFINFFLYCIFFWGIYWLLLFYIYRDGFDVYYNVKLVNLLANIHPVFLIVAIFFYFNFFWKNKYNLFFFFKLKELIFKPNWMRLYWLFIISFWFSSFWSSQELFWGQYFNFDSVEFSFLFLLVSFFFLRHWFLICFLKKNIWQSIRFFFFFLFFFFWVNRHLNLNSLHSFKFVLQTQILNYTYFFIFFFCFYLLFKLFLLIKYLDSSSLFYFKWLNVKLNQVKPQIEFKCLGRITIFRVEWFFFIFLFITILGYFFSYLNYTFFTKNLLYLVGSLSFYYFFFFKYKQMLMWGYLYKYLSQVISLLFMHYWYFFVLFFFLKSVLFSYMEGNFWIWNFTYLQNIIITEFFINYMGGFFKVLWFWNNLNQKIFSQYYNVKYVLGNYFCVLKFTVVSNPTNLFGLVYINNTVFILFFFLLLLMFFFFYFNKINKNW